MVQTLVKSGTERHNTLPFSHPMSINLSDTNERVLIAGVFPVSFFIAKIDREYRLTKAMVPFSPPAANILFSKPTSFS